MRLQSCIDNSLRREWKKWIGTAKPPLFLIASQIIKEMVPIEKAISFIYYIFAAVFLFNH